MKTRIIRRSGYENGAALAASWAAESLMLAVTGEMIEGGYRLVHSRLDRREQREHYSRLGQETLDGWKQAAHPEVGDSDRAILDHVGTMHLLAAASIGDKGRYPEAQGLPERVVEEARGIADYWGADYRRVLLSRETYRRRINLMLEQPARARQAARAESPPPGCTTIVFRQSPVGPIVGRTMDSGLDGLPGLQGYGEPVLYSYPEDMGYSSISVAQANSRGLVIQGSGMAYPAEPAPEPVLQLEVYDLVLRFCSTVEEAVEIVGRYSPFIHPSNLLVCDAAGDAAVIEKTKRTLAVRRPAGSSAFTTSGVAVEEASRARLDTESAEYRSNLTRHGRLARRLDRLEPRIAASGMSDMWDVLRDTETPGPVWRHPGNQPAGELTTLYSFVLAPKLGRYEFILSDQRGLPPAGSAPLEYPYSFEG